MVSPGEIAMSLYKHGVAVVCLLTVMWSLSSVVALQDHYKGSQKKSFALFNNPDLGNYHRESRETHGDRVRVLRQASPDAGVKTYSADETRSLLDAHMLHRRNVTPSAADMNDIGWNQELADLARGWAGGCLFEHGFPSPPQSFGGVVAQNIWQGTNTFGLTVAVKAWYDEYIDYDYPSATCAPGKECGHYRIMVFGDLKEIGCGSALCGNNMLTVCNYGPSVPQNGVPYKAGPPCGLCSSGNGWCENKLCRSDCSSGDAECECKLQCQNCGVLDSSACTCDCKAGWAGTDCSESCVDGEEYCKYYVQSTCTGDVTAQKDCPATCGICDNLAESTPTGNKCCDGKMCSDGEVLDEASCSCVNYLQKTKAGGGAGHLAPAPWILVIASIWSLVEMLYSC